MIVNVMLFRGRCLSKLRVDRLLLVQFCEHLLDKLLKLTLICSSVSTYVWSVRGIYLLYGVMGTGLQLR